MNSSRLSPYAAAFDGKQVGLTAAQAHASLRTSRRWAACAALQETYDLVIDTGLDGEVHLGPSAPLSAAGDLGTAKTRDAHRHDNLLSSKCRC